MILGIKLFRITFELALNPALDLIPDNNRGDLAHDTAYRNNNRGGPYIVDALRSAYEKLKRASDWSSYNQEELVAAQNEMDAIKREPFQTEVSVDEHTYTGPMDTEVAEAMYKCDSDGPLMIYVTKLYNSSDASTFDVFGQILSGSVIKG
ncbi:P-loop containing nucleoside triphosphate hydrolase protein [Gigaspora margarita]|uniref:P-loop containing nucleoside triphosphate hydrolase protein n=1 Tax=Gigaspora margarita TaxID=4874 RepID=A0A8H4AGM6_GIGMA|nr:P-loop containing nucleoside triphosphate hydrolase protein [Gigaspora margarita]